MNADRFDHPQPLRSVGMASMRAAARHRSLLSSLMLLAALFVAAAPEHLAAQTQVVMEDEACARFHAADEELNAVYSQILHLYSADTLFLERLREAQRAWIRFRDADLTAYFPAADRSAYGSSFPTCYCLAAAELTKARTTELRRWVDGVVEGDVCAGSVRVVPKKN